MIQGPRLITESKMNLRQGEASLGSDLPEKGEFTEDKFIEVVYCI